MGQHFISDPNLFYNYINISAIIFKTHNLKRLYTKDYRRLNQGNNRAYCFFVSSTDGTSYLRLIILHSVIYLTLYVVLKFI